MIKTPKYIVVLWPEVQDLMELEGFREHSYLINDDQGLNDFGSSAYFVDELWLTEVSRLNCNNQIIKIISDYVKNNPDIRFIQALYNLNIIIPEFNQYNEESSLTLKKLKLKKNDKL